MPNGKVLAALLAALPLMAAAPAVATAATQACALQSSTKLDGVYGPYTTKAVECFQRDKGLTVDGIAGPQTLKALGLSGRTLRCGASGADVLRLQKALVAAGCWTGHKAAATPAPKPTAKPVVKPTPKPTPKPVYEEPVEEPTPAPHTVAPTAAPVIVDDETMEEERYRTTLEIHAGDWLIPVTGFWYVPAVGGTTPNYDFSVLRNNLTGDATLWLGDWGIGGNLTAFNLASSPAPINLGAPGTANTFMYDGLLKYRFAWDALNVYAGYRGLNTGVGNNFGTVGVGLDTPLGVEWLRLLGNAQGGHNFSTGYFLDGQLGLGLRFNPVGLELGFRHLALQSGGSVPLVNVNGPVASLHLGF